MRHHGSAAVPLTQHGHPVSTRETDGVPVCSKGVRMDPPSQCEQTSGYRAHRSRCPLVHPQRTDHRGDHEQCCTGNGCVKESTVDAGGVARMTLDRSGPLSQVVSRQRTSCERITSQATALGSARPHVRHRRSVATLNTLTSILSTLRALQRACSMHATLLTLSHS